MGRPLPLPFPPALLVWALAVLAITAYVAACLLGARIGGDPVGAPVGGAVALVAMVALILPPVAWAGATGPPEGTVVYRGVLSDPLGSGSVLLDGSGDRVRHTVFRPFGAVYEEVGPGFGTSRLDRRYFAGHASQEETGLVYMQARWLDPEVGRFLSVDPLIRSLEKPQSLNGYSYVENHPTLFVDPTGEAAGPPGADPFEGVPEGPGPIPRAPIDSPSPSSFLAGGMIVGGGALFAPEAAAAGLALLATALLTGIVVGIANMTMSSESSESEGGEQQSGDDAATVDDVLEGATPGRETKGKTRQFEKPGGAEEANSDFDSLKPGDVRDIPGGGRTGTLPDGRRAVVRPSSSGGRPTLEIQRGPNRIKIRYGP